jgi:hypothetical protein
LSKLLNWRIRFLRFAKQHHSLDAPIAFIESHRCHASRHSNVYRLRIEKPQLPCCARACICSAFTECSRLTQVIGLKRNSMLLRMMEIDWRQGPCGYCGLDAMRIDYAHIP